MDLDTIPLKPPAEGQQRLVAAPGILTIRKTDEDGTVRELTILVAPPTTADQFAMKRWVHQHAKPASAVGHLDSEDLKKLTPEDKLIVLREFAKEKAARTLTVADAMNAASTPSGVAMMIWLSARRFDSALTYPKIAEWIDDANVTEVLTDFDAVVGVLTKDGGVDPKPHGSV